MKMIKSLCRLFWNWRHLFFTLVLAGTFTATLAQETRMVQIKAFDQQLQPQGNMEISINGKEFLAVGRNGTAITELADSDLPIRTIDIKGEELEAASWIYSKGVLEITIRKKSYQLITLSVRNSANQALPGLKLTFKGKNAFSGTTDRGGKLQMPLGLTESISAVEQFSIPGFQIKGITVMANERIITAEKIVPQSAAQESPRVILPQTPASDDYFRNFNLSMLDSIQSLTVFYSIFKNYQIKDMDPEVRKRVDAKFDLLVKQLEDSVRQSGTSLIGGITDSTFVGDDIRSLIGQVRGESQTLIDQRTEFDEKVRIINSKLEGGISNLSEESRAQLLSDLALLERLLIENESRFFKNQNDYRQIINGIKEKYFDIRDLENKLSASEAQRLEEQRVFRERLIAISVVVLVFAILVILLIYVSNALRKQKQALAKANEEIRNINENLENLVYHRTRLLEEAHRELDTFLYRASHDMRSPVCSIIGLCNIASHLSQGEPKELIERVVNTTVGMDKLLKKLSIISEINQPTNFSSIRLLPMLEEIRQRHADMLPRGIVNFTINCPDDLIIESYPNLVFTILSNLIENSAYYASLDGLREPNIKVSAMSEGENVGISVYDNGTGVDPSINDRLFDMFFKGTERSPGHGLGLYIVSKAVQVLGGKIEVSSEVGSYSIFRVILPLHGSPDSHEKIYALELAGDSKIA
jgi:signal transduction histidine kinase